MTPKHPGTILRNMLSDLGETSEHFAARIGMPIERLRGILNRERKIMPDSAALIARGFDELPWNEAMWWLARWNNYALKIPDKDPGLTRRRTEKGKKIDVETREKVLELVAEGMSSEAVGEEMGLKKMCVAGIRAADTKGQYGH